MSKEESSARRYRVSVEVPLLRTNQHFPKTILRVVVKGSLPIEFAEYISKEQYERLQCSFHSGTISPPHSTLEHQLEGEVLQIDCFLRPMDIANLLKTDLRFVAELRSRENPTDDLLGIASTSLHPLLMDKSMERWISVFAMKDSIDSTNRNSRREIGEVLFKASIEEIQDLKNNEDSAEKNSKDNIQSNNQQDVNSFEKVHNTSEDSTLTSLAKTQIELWKKSEIAEFQTRLKRIEQERMCFLEAEWNKHEKQRNSVFLEWKQEFQTAKQDLKDSISRVEDRERKLISLQESLTRRRKDLERQHSTKVQEAEDTIKRLQTEFEQHLSVEKERVTEAGTRNHQLKQQLRCSSEKVEELEQTVGELRKAAVHSDVLVLQKEVENYKKMYNDAQSRIEVLETEKNNFKQRIYDLAQRLAELQAAKVVDVANEVSCEQTKEEESSKEHVVQTYKVTKLLIKPSMTVGDCVQKDVQDFEALKSEVEQLRQKVEGKSERQTSTEGSAKNEGLSFESIDANAVKNEDVRQMLINRKELLDTGLYTKDDVLISELEARIKDLLI